MMDGIGIYGIIEVFSLLFALMGATLLVLIYFWCKGRLGFDEEAAQQMMKEEREDGR